MLTSERDALEHARPTGSQYCSFLQQNGNGFEWRECTETRRYLCEYKGKVNYSCTYDRISQNNTSSLLSNA